jgi:pentatricopeptide repeat protein
LQALGQELQARCESSQLGPAMETLAAMEELGHAPSNAMYWSLLKACRKQKAADVAIALYAKLGGRRSRENAFLFEPGNVVLAEFMISVLVSCGAMEQALEAFDRLGRHGRSAFSWTALISGHVQEGEAEEALKLYDLMLEDGTEPEAHTFVSLLRACAQMLDLRRGKALHRHAWEKIDRRSNVFIGSSLVDMYSKCGSLGDAEDVFAAMPMRCTVAWTVMMCAYVDHEQPRRALELYRQMCEECMVIDERSFVVALQACCALAKNNEQEGGEGGGRRRGRASMYRELEASMDRDREASMDRDREASMDRNRESSMASRLESLRIGQGLHADARRKGFSSNAYVLTSLLSMYERCGELSIAQDLFFQSSRDSPALWNTMISAFVEHDQPNKALRLYRLMHEEGHKPRARAIVAALQACSAIAEEEEEEEQMISIADGVDSIKKIRSFEMGSALHDDARKQGLDSNGYVVSALLNMYGKCGAIAEAKHVFNGLGPDPHRRSLVAWNAMLSAHVAQKQCEAALKLFGEMQRAGAHHDDITLISLLQVSGQTSSIRLCRETHARIVSEGFDLRPLVAFNLIFAFGKCASMADAQAVFDSLPLSNAAPWNALISGYALQGDWESTLYYFEMMCRSSISPDDTTFLALLASCANAGLVEEGTRYFESMHNRYNIVPTVQHYALVVKLLTFAGEFDQVERILSEKTLPIKPSQSSWLYLLEGCAEHGNLELAKRAFDRAIALQPMAAEAYLLLSKAYSDAGMWDMANQVDTLRIKAGAKKRQLVTWIEHASELHCFVEGDHRNPSYKALAIHLQELSGQLRLEGKVELAEELMADDENDQSLCSHSLKLALAFGLANKQQVIRLRTNARRCQQCHNLMTAISQMKQVHIQLIDDDRCHHFRHSLNL